MASASNAGQDNTYESLGGEHIAIKTVQTDGRTQKSLVLWLKPKSEYHIKVIDIILMDLPLMLTRFWSGF